jgi:uridine phosphorylase
MLEAYHLGLTKKAAGGATHALLPVDPRHAAETVKLLDEDHGVVATERGFVTHLGTLAGAPVLVVSSGIGGPSISIVAHELSNLGVDTMIGVGAMGAIQPDVQPGELVIATGAVRLDGASTHYAPIEYPALADHQVFARLRRAAEELGHKTHYGICASTDTFYPGQERYDQDGQHVVSALRGSLLEWRQLGVLGYDMEAATLLTFAAVTGARAGVVKAVVVNRARRESVSAEAAAGAEPRAIEVAVAGLRKLIKKEK